MKYQDNPHLTNKEYSLLKANYEKTQAQESEDLIELLHKMQEQLETLTSSNVDGKYDEIISKLSGSISDLEKLINTNHSQFLHKIKKFGTNPNTFLSKSPSLQSSTHPHAPNQIPNPWKAPISCNLHKLEDEDNPNENTQNGNLSNSEKFPENSENNVDNTPNNDTSDDLSSDNGNNDVDSNNNSFEREENDNKNPQNKNKRNSPQQINPIFNALKSLNVNLNNNLNRLFGKNNSKKNQNVHTSHKPPMPPQFPPYECSPNTPPNKYPHKPFPPKHIDDTMDECDISDICKNKQIDIVRLFLLYMMLTPTCHYLPTITTIANTQFEILMQLM